MRGVEKRSDTTTPAPDSEDLRQKAIEAVKDGERKTEVCRMLNISGNTLAVWLKREAQTGDYQALTKFQQGRRHKNSDGKRFREFAQQHGGKTQKQMAQLWGAGVTQQNISDALRKIGWSRKKRPTDIESATNSTQRSWRND